MSTKTNKKRQKTEAAYTGSLMDWLGGFGAEDIGVDLGSSNVVIYIRNKGLVFPEAAVVAVRDDTGRMFSYGTRAEEMEGRTPKGIHTIRPVRHSTIVDYHGTSYLLNSIINRSYIKRLFFHPRLIMCVPAGMTGVQKRALLEAAFAMGARKTVLIDQPVAAIMGMGLDLDHMEGAMIVDVGGGTTGVSVVSGHGVVVSDFTRQAGQAMDQAIISLVRDKYQVELGPKAAEMAKIALGASWNATRAPEALEVCGSSMVTGLPVKQTITSEDVAHALDSILDHILAKVRGVLQKTPPALLADIRDHGIMIAGGGGQLRGLDQMITASTGIPAYVVEHPLYVNAIGAGSALQYMNLFRDSLQDLD